MSMLKKGMYAAQSPVDVIDPEVSDGYITFSSDAPFSIKFNQKSWDGVLEYSTDTVNWIEWDASEISSVNNKMFLRGLGNSIITGVNNSSYAMTITSPTDSGVSCTGNIMTLLDHVSPETAVMAAICFSNMFRGCTNLITAPQLPATVLVDYCYASMFSGCTNLTAAPELPATVLAERCYNSMFYDCTSLTSAPELPAMALTSYCYAYMFYGCINLKSAPRLPATVLADFCYAGMFYSNGVKISETPTGDYQTPWRIPSEGTITGQPSNWNTSMLFNTSGTFKRNPSINTTYYQVGVEVIDPEDPEDDNSYLTFSSDEPFSIEFNQKSWDGVLEYSTDRVNWLEWDASEIGSSGNVLYLRGTGNSYITGMEALDADDWQDYAMQITATSSVECTGNVMTLLDHGDPENAVMDMGAFACLFFGCSWLTIAPELPATVLADLCYAAMFCDCSLTTAPQLPATVLADECYYAMFSDCINLTAAPELPATVMAVYCYADMFYGCTNLAIAPELPATVLAAHCYAYMLSECTNLTTAPELPATQLADECYAGMFFGCSNLTIAPELPATVMTVFCYAYMFRDCTNLMIAPELPATVLASQCYYYMFQGCTNLTTAPELPATVLVDFCYEGMFESCTSLTTAPELPATVLVFKCYSFMFYGCTNLTTAPQLPATVLANRCYEGMFYEAGIKISISQTGIYQEPWSIPSTGTIAIESPDWNFSMLTGTGGTFKGNPNINKIYYQVG